MSILLCIIMEEGMQNSNFQTLCSIPFPLMLSHVLLAGGRLLRFNVHGPYSASDPHSGIYHRQYSHGVNILSSPSQREYNRGRRIIDHTYRDFSGFGPCKQDTERYNKVENAYRSLTHREQSSSNIEIAKKILNEKRFPNLLHFLLSLDEDLGSIITWLPHGRSFVVRDKHRFIDNVASSHFKFTKYESFIRQINSWGFKRITQGPDMNSYYHELFLRGMPHLVKWMKRSPAPSLSSRMRGGRPLSRPCDEPNFYKISANYPIPDHYNIDEGRRILGLTMQRNGGYIDSNSRKSIFQRQHSANAVLPAEGVALRSQRDTASKDSCEGNSDITNTMDTSYSQPSTVDSPLNEPREQDLQVPSEHDWKSLWDTLSSDTGGNSNNQQVPNYELKFFIVEAATT
mmetsp:Transcript_8068/g.9385  ORF Transcript_8068/g.9385 Transcript_8068/m.9385 type:complete len:400 (-) Transcript_8068:36-1235(-)